MSLLYISLSCVSIIIFIYPHVFLCILNGSFIKIIIEVSVHIEGRELRVILCESTLGTDWFVKNKIFFTIYWKFFTTYTNFINLETEIKIIKSTEDMVIQWQFFGSSDSSTVY